MKSLSDLTRCFDGTFWDVGIARGGCLPLRDILQINMEIYQAGMPRDDLLTGACNFYSSRCTERPQASRLTEHNDRVSMYICIVTHQV